MNKVVCVGNALRDGDRAGPEAYAFLRAHGAPEGLEVVDGGLSGLALLGELEGCGSVVLVDSVRGFGEPGEVVVLEPRQVVEAAGCDGLDHASGLAYLLGVYEAVLPPPVPRVRVVGVEEPAGPGSAERAARTALSLVAEVADAAPA